MAVFQDRLDRPNITGRRSGSVEQKDLRSIGGCRWCARRQSKQCDAGDKWAASVFHELRATAITFVMRRGGPSASTMEQRANPAGASGTFVGCLVTHLRGAASG